jgi:hypothetical protein
MYFEKKEKEKNGYKGSSNNNIVNAKGNVKDPLTNRDAHSMASSININVNNLIINNSPGGSFYLS